MSTVAEVLILEGIIMAGRLYGIGVGPGDPELLTLKAVFAIEKCDVIAVPETGSGERTAFTIVEKYIEGKQLLMCRFVMEHNMEKRKSSRQKVADDIIACLDRGKDTGFITLGDPTTYSTYMYIHEIVSDRGYETTIIPGVTSYSAAAAAAGVALCEGNETLSICAGHASDIDELLSRQGNTVIMKSGAAFTRVLDKLKERGLGDNAKIVCRATMPDQRVFQSIEDFENTPDAGYFTIAIITKASAARK